MGKIVICGSEEKTQEIKSRLIAPKSEIIVLDLLEEGFPEKFLSNDLLFIATDDKQENIILSMNVNVDKIINFSRFEETTFSNPIEKMERDVQYSGLILGMSHSQCAIKPEKLTSQLYCNCASPSMDMFCHFSYLKKLAEIYPDKLEKIQHLIIELPYYIFNFDLSKFGTFVYTKLNYFDLVGDYHNFGKSDSQKNIIAEFQRFKSLFRSKEIANKPSLSKNPIRKILKKILNKYRIATNKDKIWRIIYQSTVEENRVLWGNMLEFVGKVCPNAEVTVLIMPFNPIFRRFHKKEISAMRSVFMDSLGTGRFQVIDHFACLKSDCYFDYHCHLNQKGSEEYMKILRNALFNK